MANTFYIKSGDTSPILQQTLSGADGAAVSLVGATARVHVSDRYGAVSIDEAATIVDAANGVISYTFDGTQAVGNFKYEIEVTYSDASIEKFPNVGYDFIIVSRSIA